MKHPPSFQFYPDDFLGGVCDMTQGEVGAYILLLCHQWNVGRIPEEKNRVQLIARGSVTDHVLSKFGPSGKQSRMERERRKQREYRLKQKLNGAKGGRPVGKANDNPSLSFGETQTKAKKSSLSPLSSPSPFYKAYSTKGNASVNNSASETDKADKALKKLTQAQKAIADAFEVTLGEQWVNDAGKWINRIKEHENKAWRVLAEVQSAIKEARISSTPAQYAEQIWKEFK